MERNATRSSFEWILDLKQGMEQAAGSSVHIDNAEEGSFIAKISCLLLPVHLNCAKI